MHRADPGSFRDPDGRILHDHDRVFRALTPDGLENWRALDRSGLPAEAGAQLIETHEVADEAIRRAMDEPRLLEHRRVPVISYPYEWPFHMLADAALLTLDLHVLALRKGFMLKDATPYNVQYLDGRPVFIDVPSIVARPEKSPWPGYAQFCSQFLFPLMLSAHRGVDYRPFLRGRLAGIGSVEAARILGLSSFWRAGVFNHVLLQSFLERSFRRSGLLRCKNDGLSFMTAAVLEKQALSLRRLVTGLRPCLDSVWSGYAEVQDPSYTAKKRAFLETVMAGRTFETILDLGANTGAYAALAAAYARNVIAVDGDPTAVDRIYERVRSGEYPGNLLALAIDIGDPSPAQGWNLAERSSWKERLRPDFFLALALIHHLVIANNVPLADVLAFFHRLCGEGIVELVTGEDPMARRMESARQGRPSELSVARFEEEAGRHFRIARREELIPSCRLLYHLAPLDRRP